MKSFLLDLGALSLVLAGVAAEIHLVRSLWQDRRAGPRPSSRRTLRRRLPAAGVLAAASAGLTPAIADGPGEDPWHAAIAFQPQTPAPAAEAPISTDRPGFGDSTSIVPPGRLQIETGVSFAFRNREGVESQRFNGPEVVGRIGVLEDRLEIRFATSGYLWSRADDGPGFQTAQGFSDGLVGLKVKLTDQDGALPRLVLEVMTTVGAGSREVSNRDVEPTLRLIGSYDLGTALGDAWSGTNVAANLCFSDATAAGERFPQAAASVSLSRSISSTVSVFGEYFTTAPAARGLGAAHGIDFGGAYLLNPKVQIDARVGFGLNQEADGAFAGLGVSFLF